MAKLIQWWKQWRGRRRAVRGVPDIEQDGLGLAARICWASGH